MDNLLKNVILTPFNLLYKISPETTLKILFRLKQGYRLDLQNPKTYNEKLQWIKLYDHNPLMPKCCDKYHVREYVHNKGLSNILNELLWEGFDPSEIPFDDLPDQFVVKATHGSTFNIIVKDKSIIDRQSIIKRCRKWLNADFLPCYGEWFYGIEKPRIIVEKFLEADEGGALYDYKFFCFNGEPRMIYVDTWRNDQHSINAYDTQFNLYKGVKLGYPNDDISEIQAPQAFSHMLEISRVLSKDFNHVRVDLYYTRGKIYFGELTFTKGSGFGKIEPRSFDKIMGDWLRLPSDCGEFY